MTMDPRLTNLGDRLERSVGDELIAASRPSGRRRMPLVGAAGLAVVAAGVATVLLVGSGSSGAGSPVPRLTPSAGSSASVQQTAYIIKRMRARVAATAGQGTVAETYQYSSGTVGSDGTLSNLSAPSGQSWFYRAPDTAFYWSNLSTGAAVGYAGETGNVVNGMYEAIALTVNQTAHTYSLTQGQKPDPAAADGRNTGAGFVSEGSDPAQVLAALHSGQATERGTTTVNGVSAIALQVTEPGAAPSADEQYWLYVDAQTDQPLRMVVDTTGTDNGVYRTGLYVSDWYPSTAANIAKAQDRSIPAGYTRVGDASAGTGNSGAG